MNRRQFSSLWPQALALSAAGLVAPRVAAQAMFPIEGRDFVAVPEPGASDGAGKLEVLAFFSYRCGHCRAFEPALQAWARQLPAAVALRRVPVPFLANAETLQRCFFALQAIGLLDAMHEALFAAVQDSRPTLTGPASVASFLLSQQLVPPAAAGGFEPSFTAAFGSFSTEAKLGRARALTRQYGIDSGPGVPSIVIAGRWLTSLGHAGSGPKALATVDNLLARARVGANR